jgi:RNA-splicing ligase RtcB
MWRIGLGMRRATFIVLSDLERKQLDRLKRGRRVSVRLAERAAIVLHAAAPTAYRDLNAVLRAQRKLLRDVRWLRPLLTFKG